MSAEKAGRRKVTAKEAAAKFGVSERTIRRIIAEPRDEFLARAAERRAKVLALRAEGLTYREIGEEIGTTTGAVGRLLRDAKLHAEREAQKSQEAVVEDRATA
ncbi:sigma factor-like helix-turn-helix DNA-binding protein [Kineococcus rhizosphaerae]|uniref:Sigma-70-like protein n=1 Tax=Kineococcus rhizosphaerae TaxID=559628 RepID=A0A2T0QNB6_9ACTN|nr:sigma factor-like helix-turn-helix DNA-binding protein [Kineococcus rhizosphaerae]PRY06102.1 sigma-70-like protein [Kineococcus rhizosphaerae]